MLLKTQGVVRLSSDVEIKYSQSGSAIASFSIVSSEKFKTKAGEQKENTTFINATAFGRLGEICNQYLRKGSQVYIDGKIKQENWTDQQGNKRSKHSVTVENLQMLGSKDEAQDPNGNGQPTLQNPDGYNQPAPQAPQPTQNPVPEIDIDEDQIPF